MKLLIIAGGALTMQKAMALVGNLVSQGAGSNELRDNALSMGGLAKMAGGVAGKALGVASLPLKPFAGIASNAYGMQIRHLGGKLLTSIGLDGGGGAKGKGDDKDKKESSDSANNDKANYGSDNKVKDAISNNDGFKQSFGSGNNNNNNNTQQGKKSNPVGDAINGGGKNDQKGENK
jgi:hypothetical protein